MMTWPSGLPLRGSWTRLLRRGDNSPVPDSRPVVLRNWSLITFEVIVAAAAALLWSLWFTYPTVALAVRDGARSWGAVLGAVVVTLVQAAFVVGIVGFLRQRVIVTATGLVVKNVMHTNTITWSELGGLSAQIIIGDAGDRWQGVVALLAGSDRAVALMATTTRRPERCQHYLDQLRSLAPPTALTADTVAHTPAPAVLRPAHPRDVAWWYVAAA